MLHLRQMAFTGGGDDFGAPIDPYEQFLFPTSGVAPNGKPIFNWDQAADQITRHGDTWNALPGPLTITFAFRSTAPLTMPDGTGGFTRFTDVQIVAAEAALQYWADVANITFTRVGSGVTGDSAYSNNATILFGNYSTGDPNAAAFAFFAAVGQRAAGDQAGDVWVNSTLDYNANPTFLAYGPQVLLHEIGHALGLEHPGDYDASDAADPTYDANAVYWQDTRMFTVMSYFGSANTGGSLPGFSNGPQLHDIAAIQSLYGANMTTRTGDTIYGFHSNTGEDHFTITSSAQGAVFAIWDAGGNDTLDLSGYSTNSNIDLRQEAFSSAGPGDATSTISTDALYNISIARGVVIENAIGGSGNDTITGNDVANVLNGGAGADTLIGGAGNDTYIVDNAGDVVTEAASAGTDTVKASISYVLGANIEKLTLTGSAALNATGNTLANTLTGNAGANTLDGGAGADALTGNAGADVLIGGAGGDWLEGGDGVDTAIYSGSPAGITVNLQTGAASGGDAQGDTLVTIENLVGTAFNDTVVGSDDVNVLTGGGGNDVMNGGAGNDTIIGGVGADKVTGGDGVDAASYATAAAGVTANLFDHTLNTGDAAGDIFSSIEVLTGSAFNDTLTGTSAANRFDGGAGADTMIGGAGNDVYIVDNAGDVVSETLSASGGVDKVQSSISYQLGANLENLTLTGSSALNGTGNSLANTLYGNSGANTLNGGAGDDTLLGNGGHDILKGGAGADHFVFSSLNAADSDSITDFSHADDTIDLDNAVFTALGPDGALSSNAFWSGSTGIAHDADDRIIYNSATGQLYYDADGNGAGAAVLIATLTTHPTLDATDFGII